ncbi:YbaK/EbsC family protein [Candidatus Pacearchaeota archaeon]|nr:YbaK/EbsC family protein [Candidatus Pacearchaeota archaeon]
MLIRNLKDFLDEKSIRYTCISHSPAYTAQGIAAITHISGKEIAKTVMIKINGTMEMVVLPASHKVDLDLMKAAASTTNVELAHEEEFKDAFPDCEIGAMPPFGNLYGMRVFVAEALTKDDEIAFNACSHHELIRMAYADFEMLVKPQIVRVAFQSV